MSEADNKWRVCKAGWGWRSGEKTDKQRQQRQQKYNGDKRSLYGRVCEIMKDDGCDDDDNEMGKKGFL